MKITSRILCLILCLTIFITSGIVGVEAASVKVAVTEKLVAEATADSVELRWRKVKNATGYKVYQVVDGELKALKTVKKGTKYVVEDLTASETYKFAVKTYRKTGGKTYWSKKYKSVKVTTDKMGKTPTPKATAAKNSVTLKWSEVEGATGYRIYQYSPSKDKYVVKASIKDKTTYKVTGLKEDTVYKFKIKPYAKTSKGTVWAKASSARTIQTVDKTKAKFTDPVIGTKGVTLNWSKVDGATAYRLYKVVDGEYLQIASGIKDTSYNVKKLESGKKYTFVVRAYKKANGKVNWYTKSEPLTITTKITDKPTTTDPSAEESTTKPTTTEPTTTKPTTTEPTTTDPVTKPTDKKEHTVVIDPAVEATCTKTGLTEGKHCSVCNEVIVAQKVVPKKAHSYKASVTTEATCKAEGVKTYKCSACGDSYTEKIAKKSHSYKSSVTTEATCKAEGIKTYKCSVCDHSYTEKIPKKAHDYKASITTEATCKNDGVKTYKCSVCSDSYTEKIAKKAHDYKASVTTEATCKAEGVKTYKCSMCDHSYTEKIARKAHTLVTDPAVEATCTNTGLTEGKHCSVCGAITVSQIVVSMKAHSDKNSDGKCDLCKNDMGSTEPTTPPDTEDELISYRLDKYKKILENETVYFKISSEYSDGTMVPVEFAQKNGNMYMETTAEGLTMRIYYDKAKNKMTAYADLIAAWVYYNVPEKEMDDMDITEMLEILQVGEHGFVTVTHETFNKKSVICESFLDNKTGYTMKYYFDGETLVGIERIHPKKVDETIYIDKISNSVKDSFFEPPKPTLIPPKAVVSLDEWLSEN